MVVVSAWHVGGTRGSGIVSSAADVLWMSLVRGMRGVGGEWMRGLGLGFTNPVVTVEVLDVWMCGCVWVTVVWVVGRGLGPGSGGVG